MKLQFGDIHLIEKIHRAEQEPAEPRKRRYRISGYVRVWVEEEIEAESEDEAYEEAVENIGIVNGDLDTFGLKAEDVTPDALDKYMSDHPNWLDRLKAWNAGEPIRVAS